MTDDAQHDAHTEDREWTHDPLERSFFSTVGKGYGVGIVVFGLFGFLVARTQAPDWGFGAAIGAAVFVAVFVGILGGVVLIGLWAMNNEELIRGNETGHAPSVDEAQGAATLDPAVEETAGEAGEPPATAEATIEEAGRAEATVEAKVEEMVDDAAEETGEVTEAPADAPEAPATT